MTAIEGRLGKLEEQEQGLRTSLNAQHRSIGRLLSAIQRMGRNPPPVMITRRSDALAMVRSAMLLARAFPKLRGEALVLSRQLNRLVALMSGIRTESERLRREAKTLKDAQTRLSYLMQTKRKSLGDRKVELAEVRRTVKVVGGTVDNLEDLIRKLGPAIDRNTRLGQKLVAAERRKAIAEAEAAATARSKAQADKLKKLRLALNVPKNPVPPSAGGKPENTTITLPSEGGIRPKPSYDLSPNGGAYIGDSARIAPAIPFHRAKGQLPLPAAGQIETRFGEPVKFGGRSKGIKIKTRYGAQITSPADGWVVYAGKFRTYGQIVIIKTGKGFHVLLAGLSRIDVQSGQFVLAAEPVGTMKSAPGARSGANSPRLYVEFRKDGRPINPRPWWSASSKQKVQG
ncbi:MAG: peptidoglycan DD-metalloendopeptidase family protein [Hyphomicrobiaceae bacterium]